MFEATQNNDLDFIRNYDGDVDVRSTYGQTPLHKTCSHMYQRAALKTAELLIEKGANVNAKDECGNTPLYETCVWHSYEMAELLIDKGADVNAKNDDNNTPLHNACMWNDYEIAALLISKGADIEAKDNYGKTPLDYVDPQEMKDLLIKVVNKINEL